MRRLLCAALLLAPAVLSGCATIGIGAYTARPLDVAAYRTWDWGPADPLPTGDPRLDNNAIFQDHLTGEIGRQLEDRGLRRVEAGTEPDLRIHYHAAAVRRLRVHTAERPAEAGAARPDPTYTEEYEAGTIVLDFVDARTNRLVWRGWAEDALDNMLAGQEQIDRHVDVAVTRMMARMPFGR